ncbi:MAG: hypothetical protein KatS3mg057_1793 [Herpetosiphonaceae bacterium]|nr:MAG: hypothetical protein KatS3mg057_1793 [Herpetosiphonaceae bacterium]
MPAQEVATLLTFWQTYGFYLWLLSAMGFLGLAGAVVILWRRLRRAISSYQAPDSRRRGSAALDSILLERSLQIQRHEEALADLGERLSLLECESLRHAGLVRFNAFGDVGGDQSFALALLDGKKNGIVISTIYTRGATRIYAKAVQAGQSIHHLSDEEIAAIERATGLAAMTVQELKER